MPARTYSPEELEEVSRLVRSLRARAGMSQRELAFQVGTTTRAIQRWEQAGGGGTKLGAVDLLKILSVFGVEIPGVPRLASLATELRRIYERLDALVLQFASNAGSDIDLAGALDEIAVPSADAIGWVVRELNAEAAPSATRLAEMRSVADGFWEAALLAVRLGAALRARIEAAESGP